jgi:rare lipoprotein A
MRILGKTSRVLALLVVLIFKLFFLPVTLLAKPVTGLVSWYGQKFAGKKMANGEKFDPSKLTAAHRSLPFGTQVRLICRKTQREVIVTITDRGPVQKTRTLDISRAAADALGIRDRGIARVEIEPLKR